MLIPCVLNNKCVLHINTRTDTWCKINIKNTATCFVINTPSSGSLQVVLAKGMNY